MKNVKRTAIPITLSENAKNWTDDLVAAIDKHKKTGEGIPDSVKDKYKQEDVLDTLKQIYKDRSGTCFCCYCESPIEDAGYPHIEHRKPKDKNLFPKESFNWDNLHLACQKCNIKKGNKWNTENEILDAVKDIPIEKHLSYKVEFAAGVYIETLSERGITTEKHTDLNRESLLNARLLILDSIKDSLAKIKSSSNDPRTHTAKQILIDKCRGRHGSLITWALRNEGLIK